MTTLIKRSALSRTLIALSVFFGGMLWYSSALWYGYNAGEEPWFCLTYTAQDALDIFTKATYHLSSTHYRPLWQLSYAIDDALWGRNPFGYHFDSIFLLALFAALLFVFFDLLLKDRLAAALTAAIFLVTPQMAYQGAYITHRGDALAGIPLLLMLITLVSVRSVSARLLINVPLLVVSFFIKEFSVVFAAFAALVHLHQNNFSWRRLKKPVFVELGVYAAVTAIFLWFRLSVLTNGGPLEALPAGDKGVALGRALWVNNFLALFHEQTLRQHGLFFLYSFVFWAGAAIVLLRKKFPAPFVPYACAAALIIARIFGSNAIFIAAISLYGILLLALLWKRDHTDRTLLFALLWIAAGSVVLFSKREERLVFFAVIGAAFLLASFTRALLERVRESGAARGGLAAVIILIGIYASVNRAILSEMRPETALTQFEQLYSYGRMLGAGRVWEGKAMDAALMGTVKDSLQNQGLIDDENTLLIDSGDLGRRAFWFLIPNRFNFRVFGYQGALDQPNYAVLDMWRAAGLPVVNKISYSREP